MNFTIILYLLYCMHMTYINTPSLLVGLCRCILHPVCASRIPYDSSIVPLPVFLGVFLTQDMLLMRSCVILVFVSYELRLVMGWKIRLCDRQSTIHRMMESGELCIPVYYLVLSIIAFHLSITSTSTGVHSESLYLVLNFLSTPWITYVQNMIFGMTAKNGVSTIRSKEIRMTSAFLQFCKRLMPTKAPITHHSSLTRKHKIHPSAAPSP